MRIAAVDLRSSAAVVSAIAAQGGDARDYICDITDPVAVEALVRRIDVEMGGIDVLVNNAGIYDFTPHETVTFETWRRIMSLNVDGMFLVTQAAIPGMKARKWGRIINIASNSCFIPPPGLTAYVASKTASMGYVRALAGELGQYGITVNAVAPGPTVTETMRAAFLEDASFDSFMQGFLTNQAIKLVSLPEFSAPAVAFFASDGAAFVTGQTLVVDGGDAKH